jgi:hypothetical protein
METTREIALRTYTDATKYGMQDTPMNWHIWKRAFDIAESELKKLRVADVSHSMTGDGMNSLEFFDMIKKHK